VIASLLPHSGQGEAISMQSNADPVLSANLCQSMPMFRNGGEGGSGFKVIGFFMVSAKILPAKQEYNRPIH